VRRDDPPDGGQQQGERQVGDGAGVAAGRVDDRDAPGRRGGEVDVVDADPVLGDDPQGRGGGEDACVDPVQPDDERVGVADDLGEVRRRERVPVGVGARHQAFLGERRPRGVRAGAEARRAHQHGPRHSATSMPKTFRIE
jgi:hypothetical protein